MAVTFTDLHIHTEYSLRDGMIRIADHNDPKHIKSELVRMVESRNTGAICATDHGNMYGQAVMASVAKTFDLKHIPGCEFYIAPQSRHIKNNSDVQYRHICVWAKNKTGYKNMCIMQKVSYEEGFYGQPRIDKELLDTYKDGLIVSDACVGGTLSPLILKALKNESALDMAVAFGEFMWYLDTFKDDFYIEYQNHKLDIEDQANAIKIQWANDHGVPIIATTDAHFAREDDTESHKALLCIQYGRVFDDPAFNGFGGDGYHLMTEDELVERFPVDYINNTQRIVDKVEGNIISFGEIVQPQFRVPKSFMEEISNERRTI